MSETRLTEFTKLLELGLQDLLVKLFGIPDRKQDRVELAQRPEVVRGERGKGYTRDRT